VYQGFACKSASAFSLTGPRELLRRSTGTPQNCAFHGQEGFVVDTLDVLPAVEAVAPNCVDTFSSSSPVGLIVEILIAGYGVLLAIRPQNTKLFYEIHASSLVFE
jgi:hypothetical protein